MTTDQTDDHPRAATKGLPPITGSRRRTLEAIFHHPSAHNLEWRHVVALIADIGEVNERANSEFLFEVAGRRHVMRKPHSKDLTSSELIEIRRFLMQAGLSAELASESVADPTPSAPSLLVVVDYDGAKIFLVDDTSESAAEHVLRPYDPHHVLHHLAHKDQSRERGQRAAEEPAYYEKIAEAVALAGKIVVAGHGAGKSNAAHHLTEYLQTHHPGTYRRIVREIVADLSSITAPQLLDLARDVLRV